jgi:penicillin-binding protein 1A
MANMAYTLGLGTLKAFDSLVLGSQDESVLQMAGAYSVFADAGVYNEPHAILEVRNSSGAARQVQLQLGKPTGLTKSMTDIVTYCLRQVVLGGTGTAAGFRIPVAGKTGTTETNADAWFVGYTPQPGLTTAVWMGYPDSSVPMHDIYGVKGGITGGSLPADIFRRFMSIALVGQAAGNFDNPGPFTGKTLGQPVAAVFPTTTTSTSTSLPNAPGSTLSTTTTEVSTKPTYAPQAK